MADDEDAITSEIKARAHLLRGDAKDRVRARIRRRMAETGISMNKLAERAGVSTRTIQRFLAEPGRDIYVGTVASIAAVLLVDVQDLFTPADDE